MTRTSRQLLVVAGLKELELSLALDCDAVNRYSYKRTVVFLTQKEFVFEVDDEMIATDGTALHERYRTVAPQGVLEVPWFRAPRSLVCLQGAAALLAISLCDPPDDRQRVRYGFVDLSCWTPPITRNCLFAIRLSFKRLAELRALRMRPLTLGAIDDDEVAWRASASARWRGNAVTVPVNLASSRCRAAYHSWRQHGRLTFLGSIVDSHRMAFDIRSPSTRVRRRRGSTAWCCQGDCR